MTQSDMEKLAILKALQTVLDQEVEDLKAEARADLIELNEKHGVSQLELIVGGEKVGTLSVTHKKAKTRQELVINDKQELFADNTIDIAEFVREHAQEYAEWALHKHGLVPDGCDIVEVEIPATLGTPTLKGCKPEDVLPKTQEQLPATIAGLLEAGK